VHATFERITSISFRSGEGVQLGGWDGIVVVEGGNAFVPDGTSGWEVSTNEDPSGKADDDYEKRLANPHPISPSEGTFAFVTLRRWAGKQGWEDRRRSEGVWRSVRAYDADDLEGWLEQAPAVHIWLSILLGKHPGDALDLESYWADWSTTTRPATPPEFVLAGRGEVIKRIHGWLTETPGALALRAGSRDEACAVFAAAIQRLPVDERDAQLSRVVLVPSLSGWTRLTSERGPLLLVPLFDAPEAIPRAIRMGHRVLVPLGQADPSASTTVNVPRLSRDEAAEILVSAGLPEDRARELAALARSSLMSFRRKLAVSNEVQQPQWARPVEARGLLPALLAGAWDEGQQGDREAIARLARISYEQWSPAVVRWSNETDPPVRRVGDAWFVISKEDMWSLIAQNLTRDDLDRFDEVVMEALGTPDPRYDLPARERWMAAVRGAVSRHSAVLRAGLADTLAIMGARGDTLQIAAGTSARDYATYLVRRLLKQANADWRIWASLSSSLSLLAEAAPDAFLSVVEEGHGAGPILVRLFTQGEDGLFGDAPYAGLLWALETLAWSREHLSLATLALARLAGSIPGEVRNRPQQSLRAVFLLWHPQTPAPLDQRLAVIDMLRQRQAEVAWVLLRDLIPKQLDIGGNTPKPRWREWAPESVQTVTHEELDRGVREVASRMLSDVGRRGSRWQDLIEILPRLPGEQYTAAVDRLAGMDVGGLPPADRAAIWHSLRKLIASHRSFPDADWALPSDRIDALEGVFRRFEPTESAARYGWLFGNAPALPKGRGGDWRARQEALEIARREAVQTMYAEAGLSGLVDLTGKVEESGELGVALATSDLASAEEDNILRQHLGAEDRARALFARGFVVGRVRQRGREWAEHKWAEVARDWSPAQRAEFLFCLPSDARTWALVESSDHETDRHYWRLILPYGIGEVDTEVAVRKLLAHGRPYAAVDLLGAHSTRVEAPSAGLIADALEGILRASAEDERPSSSSAHYVEELLDVLGRTGQVDEARLAALEWGFLTLLGTFARRPKLLQRALARDPTFFAQVVALVYQAEGEEPRDLTPEEQPRWQRAYELLDSWRTVPGASDNGIVEAGALREWVQQARELNAADGRRTDGDRIIGRILSAAPPGPDGTWPQEAVRDVIEEVRGPDLEQGFETGVHLSRGTVRKGATEGGAQECVLAERFERFAAQIADGSPHTARILRRIADQYRAEALREDQRAQLREDLHGW
jgi:hypothetical protein